jgi:sugar lactone lactonase YvrE
MKFKITMVILAFTIFMVLMIACEGPDQPTYNENNDPNPTGNPAAVISSLSPTEGFLKDVITINGSGFNTTPEYNLVAFGTQVANCISASATKLEVIAPNLSDETVNVKMAVKGSEFWSNELEFTFYNTLEVIDEEIVWPNGVAVDDNDNVYIGSADEGIIYKIDPDGNKTEFAEVPISGSMEFGPENYLYICAQGEGKIVRVSPDGNTIEDVVEVESPIDFDWDANGDMYIVSNWIEAEEMGGIFRYDTGGNLTQLVTLGSCKCLRIFENILVVSDIWEGNILRYDITASGLENETVILSDFTALGIEFDANGMLYFTHAWEETLYFMEPEEGAEMQVMYDGQLMTPMHYLTFYKKKMYIVYPGWGDVGMTMSAYIGVDQAPNYGRP